jgi:tetrahydromethanopterin S-methyltransferase subunit G
LSENTNSNSKDALDVTKAEIKTTIDGIQELSFDLSAILETPEETVNVPKNELKRIQERLKTLADQNTKVIGEIDKQETGSKFSLYYSLLIGILFGVVGNFFVQLTFESLTTEVWIGWIITGLTLLVACIILFIMTWKYSKHKP